MKILLSHKKKIVIPDMPLKDLDDIDFGDGGADGGGRLGVRAPSEGPGAGNFYPAQTGSVRAKVGDGVQRPGREAGQQPKHGLDKLFKNPEAIKNERIYKGVQKMSGFKAPPGLTRIHSKNKILADDLPMADIRIGLKKFALPFLTKACRELEQSGFDSEQVKFDQADQAFKFYLFKQGIYIVFKATVSVDGSDGDEVLLGFGTGPKSLLQAMVSVKQKVILTTLADDVQDVLSILALPEKYVSRLIAAWTKGCISFEHLMERT